jgi:hypothetical protein
MTIDSKLIVRPTKPSRAPIHLDVRMPDQDSVNLLVRSLASRRSRSHSTYIGKLIKAGLETLAVPRLRFAHVTSNDDETFSTYVSPWSEGTYESLEDLWHKGPVYREEEPDPYDEADRAEVSSARGAIAEYIPVPGPYDYLVACGCYGELERGWDVLAIRVERMLALSNGTYITYAAFQQDPLAYRLA